MTMFYMFWRRVVGGLFIYLLFTNFGFCQGGRDVSADWKIRMLALDANEGLAIGDIDGNGSPDIVSGRNWYAAPDFAPRPLRIIEDWNGYVESNGDFLWDMNLDGRLDVLSQSFLPTEVCWFENPGDEGLRLGKLWKRHVLIDTQRSQNEGALFEDLDNDGVPEWIVNSWNEKNPMLVWRLVRTEKPDGESAWFQAVPASIAAEGNSHGLGVGDLNGDGRKDLLIGSGWFEQPATNPWGQPWQFHADWKIQGSIPMLVMDVDSDGQNDVIVGEGHNFGLYWLKQTLVQEEKKSTFVKREIDRSYSEVHTLALVDLDGDSLPELIAGKRYYAHNGSDPGGKDLPLLCYYKIDRSSGSFKKSIIEHGHVGVGLQIGVADFNRDGQVDLAVAGKSGTYLLINAGSKKQ